MKSNLKVKMFESHYYEDIERRVNDFIADKEVVFPPTHTDRANDKIVVVIWYREYDGSPDK